MTTITITKTNEGKLDGLGEKGRKAYARFRAKIAELEIGGTLSLKVWFPRSPKFHKFHFALLNAIFDAQEVFDDPDIMRMWLQVGAGFCDYRPGTDGQLVAIPKSIAFDRLDDEDFAQHHEAIKRYLRSPQALAYLWPHTTTKDAAEGLESILNGFIRA